MFTGYSGYGTPYPPNSYYGQQSFNPRHDNTTYRDAYNTHVPTAPPQHPYTAGLSEEEQYESAVRASLNNRGTFSTVIKARKLNGNKKRYVYRLACSVTF